MRKADTLRRSLALAAPEPPDPGKAARVGARVMWVHEVMGALRAAQKRADDAWMALVAELPEDEELAEAEEELPEPPEQAELDAIWEVVNAVVEHDRWPAHLYFKGV